MIRTIYHEACRPRRKRVHSLLSIKSSWYTVSGGHVQDFITLLHPPYTLWHLSYVVLGIAISPVIRPDRSIAVVIAYFLGLGIGAHALDESAGNPLKTKFTKKNLYIMGVLGLGSAIAIGIYYTLTVSLLLSLFIVAETFFALVYNLELLQKRFHTSLVFALSWGSIPLLTSFYVNSLVITPVAALMAVAVGLLTLVQKTLSLQVRTMRRNHPPIKALMFEDGNTLPVSTLDLISPSETSLKLLVLTVFLFAVALVAGRVL
jgi:hypothetical protein